VLAQSTNCPLRIDLWYELCHTMYITTRESMRLIEQQMIDAIKQRKDWKKDNTAVYYDSTIGVTSVHLHCNHIASISDEEVEVYDGGWQSNTTKSRLNAIINGLCDGFTCSVYQHKFEWFITDDKLIHQFENGYTFARV